MQVVWEGSTGTRRGRVGAISPAPFLVAVQRGDLAGSPARPASRRTRVVKPPLRMRSARAEGRRRAQAPLTDARIVTPQRARRNHVTATRHALVALIAPTGRCARSQRAGLRSGHPRGRHPRRQASHDRPSRALWHRPSHQRPRPAVLDCGRSRWRCFVLRQRRPVPGHHERGVLDTSATANHPCAGASSVASSPPPPFGEKSAAVTPANAPVVDAVKPATSVAQPLSPTVQTSWLSQYA